MSEPTCKTDTRETLARDAVIPAAEKEYLRELAKKQREYANLPVMAERKRLWYLHNRLAGERPMVVMEEDTFLPDILPKRRCEHPLAALIEGQLGQIIAAHETFDDDKVVPDFFSVNFAITTDFLGQKQKRIFAGQGPGFHIEPAFETLEEGLPLLRPSEYHCDEEAAKTLEKAAQDILGDILPLVRKNAFNHWFFTPTQLVVNLMGMENMYYAMMSEAEDFHRLMRLVVDDLKCCLRWQEEQGLLVLNNGNDYMGSGSFCFSDELPQEDYDGRIRSRDLWGHINSQESIGISPEQFAEFVYPYYEELAAEYGLVYYGCCEPVHAYWDSSLCRLPNLRKISISPWCDEGIMAERLAGSNVIYSRKPSPNFIGIKAEFDEEAFSAYIQKTAAALKGRCRAEFIFRDIYTLSGNPAKTRRAVELTRRIAEEIY
ncbi:MAG: hypothetical protein LBC60_10595 [Spirochaetaceae bacterium]|jgi:hypothetical protein|nr:hypothetical protein [Spirochaetaceae bacterium]